MKMYKHRKLISMALVIPLVVSLFAAIPATAPIAAEPQQSIPIYQDTSYSFEERAADLLSRLTLAQKASLMISSRAAAVSSLGIREYGWWNEALHGVSAMQLNASGNATTLTNTTSYPIALSLGSTWDPELMYREAAMISDEAREVAPDNIRNLSFWSPTINLSRDPRWGRNDESYGEDPFLVTKIAAQFVNGMEGKDMQGNLLPEGNGYLKTIATLKHYAANNSEVNRLNGSSNMDDRTLREYYTAAFKGIVQEANVHSVMTAYNRVNEVPASASVYLMDNLLRQTFGFTGYITSDCDAVYEISAGHHWIPPGWAVQVDQTTRTAFALSAGVDLNCNAGYNDGQNYSNRIAPAVSGNYTTETGLFTENDVDTALLRLLTARMQLGEFDVALGLNVPWATDAKARVPSWTNSNTNQAITETPARLAMAREVAAKSLVLLKNNEKIRKDGTVGKLLPIPVPTTGSFKVLVIGVLGNVTNFYRGGYSSTQGSYGQANNVTPYNGIRTAIQAINPSATVDFLRGFTGTSTSASGLTTINTTHVNESANYDWVIVYVGTDSTTAGESRDRSNITLPGAQASLISQVAAKNPNTVVVMETVGLVDVTTFEPSVAAMLWSSYNGQRKGEALADVLLGAYNPSGRLPFIWYQTNSQIPAITNYAIRPVGTTGRTYMYFSGPLAYPFGHGLSYTTFEYSNLQITPTELDANDTFQVSVDVTNTGSVYGDEVVELYITTPDAPAQLERPIKRLRGFQKVGLEPGETKTVTLSVAVPDLAFFDQALGRYVVDNGRYGVQISKSSADADIMLQDFIQVSGTLKPVLEVVTVKPHQEGDEALDIPTRVRYTEGKIIVPKVTVAMNDETLYGYIKKNGNVPFPEGMTFEYSSNRPEVVSVDENGVIRAVNEGVATITVTVTYEGVSKSTHFVAVVANTAPILSAADIATQDVQYTDAIQEVTLTATDVALDLPLSVTTQWKLNAGAFQYGLPDWLTLTQSCTSEGVLGTCALTLAGTAPVQAGTFVVRITVSDGLASSSSRDVTIVVKPEDAFIEYTGETIKLIGDTLTLRATVWDSAASGYPGANPESAPNATVGDITKMWIAFDIYPANGCLIDTPTTLYAQVEDTGGVGDGIGTASSTFSSASEAAFCVFARLVAGPDGSPNQWYTAPSAETVLTFYEASGQFATGGGWIDDPNGGKGNFGFHARYLKKGLPQGNLVYIFRGDYQGEQADFVIKSNSLNALAFSGSTFPIQATLQGKCTIQINRASDGVLLYSEGNATFQASFIDTDGEDDSFSLIVYLKNGVPYKQVPMTTLGGGNIVIHN
jgi:beta-glucosidase